MVDVQGQQLEVSRDHVPAGIRDIWLGVRPEKLRLGEQAAGTSLQGRGHRRVLRASPPSTSSGCLGRELVVVQQNDGSARARVGENATISWLPSTASPSTPPGREGRRRARGRPWLSTGALDRSASPGAPQRTGVPYALLAPGLLFLFVFFVTPMITLFSQSLQEGSVEEGYTFTGNVSVYSDALQAYWTPVAVDRLCRTRDVVALLLGYPLAYFIAQKAGRWKNVVPVLVIARSSRASSSAPAWRTILSDTAR